MKIITTITVKQVLTETSKKELFDRFNNQKLQLQKELEQLRLEMKRMEKNRKYPKQSIQQYFDKEIEDRNEKIKLLNFQLEQLDLLPLGSLLKEREIEGLMEVKVGDNWNEHINAKTIIVKDGVVESIK